MSAAPDLRAGVIAPSAALKNLSDKQGERDDQREDESGVGGDDSVGSETMEVFSTYVASAVVDRGVPHPGEIAEASSLSAIQLPKTNYPLWDAIPSELVDSGKLSQLQLEGILYACSKHQQFLPSGERAGFFIGDGAGVGKGRQIAGIVLDNYARGRRRAVWMSTSSDLHHDAERDLAALGCHVKVVNNVQTLDRETRATGLAKDFQEGVLFMTYSTLISSVKGRSRLQRVVDWVGGADFAGCLVFDECHKAKNFSSKEGAGTKVAAAVLEIQQLLPRARVVYCSATGVSEVGNMAYMTRLGLWGPGSAFASFDAFLDSMKKRGVSFMEMLAMEMKAEGFYVARGLSFRQAEFMELECKLTREQVASYNAAVELWQDLRRGIVKALAATNTTSRDVWKAFWSAQQRFFKLLCVSMKVPTVVAEARRALEEGHCVVIGLQSTGEAAADALGLEPGQVCGWVSTTRELLSRFVATHFLTRCMEQPPDQGEDAPAVEGAEDPESAAAKAALLLRISRLQLPVNFLDALIDELGGPAAVAEMTGRKARVVRDARGKATYVARAKPDSSEMDSLNVKETAKFMAGERLVAIVSDAASTGISLHASREVRSQRRRTHLTIELPWSADKAIQQLGRTHRSNQASAPLYKLVVSNLGGEKRFISAVARRLQSLGALTRGDRRAASGLDISEHNLDSPLGRKSLKKMYDCLVLESPQLPPGVQLAQVLEGSEQAEIVDVLRHLPQQGAISAAALAAAVTSLHERMRDCVDLMGMGESASTAHNDTVAEDTATAAGVSKRDMGDVRRFLNRLLGLPVAKQNLVFDYFLCTLTAEIRAARAEGKYSEGVSDMSVSNILEPPEPQVLWTDHFSGLNTLRYDLTIDRGVSFQEACTRLDHEKVDAKDSSGFYVSRRPMFGRVMAILAIQKPGSPNTFAVCRPNTGSSFFDVEREELVSKYRAATLEQAEATWTDIYTHSKERCMHGPNCTQGDACTVGRRLTTVAILSGSIVRVWGALESVLARHEGMLSKADRTMRIVRVDFGAKGRLIGVRFPPWLLGDVVMLLSSAKDMMAKVQSKAPQAIDSGAPAGAASEETLQAAAMGAGGALRTEPVSPVSVKALARALRPPRTVLDFFKTKATAGGAPAGSGVSTSKPLAAACNDQKRRTPTQPGGGSIKKPRLQAGDFFTPRLHTGPQEGRLVGSIDLTSPLKAEPIDLDSKENDVGVARVEGREEGEGEQTPLRDGPAEDGGAPPVQQLLPGGMQKATALQQQKGAYHFVARPVDVQSLASMGFSTKKAERALRATQGDLSKAVNWIINSSS